MMIENFFPCQSELTIAEDREACRAARKVRPENIRASQE